MLAGRALTAVTALTAGLPLAGCGPSAPGAAAASTATAPATAPATPGRSAGPGPTGAPGVPLPRITTTPQGVPAEIRLTGRVERTPGCVVLVGEQRVRRVLTGSRLDSGALDDRLRAGAGATLVALPEPEGTTSCTGSVVQVRRIVAPRG